MIHEGNLSRVNEMLMFCEGPSMVAVTQMWWRRSEQTNRTAYWNAMNGFTFVFGSLSTYGLGHIVTNKLYSYQVSICCRLFPVSLTFL